jgi:putative Mg2+ transporter-C (MgtC) family protein
MLTNTRRGRSEDQYGSIYPCIQNILLAWRGVGLGASLTTAHMLFEDELAAPLGVPDSYGIVAIIPIGYPRGRFGPVERRPAEELTYFARWDNSARGFRLASATRMASGWCPHEGEAIRIEGIRATDCTRREGFAIPMPLENSLPRDSHSGLSPPLADGSTRTRKCAVRLQSHGPKRMPEDGLTEISARLLIAVLFGTLIGINRDLHGKPAGLRTHALVGLGAALAVVVCARLASSADRQADVISRVAQGVVTGVGFLGAGVILRDPGNGRVHGLTTAAAIWVTALFGVASGAGAYREVGVGLVLVFLVLLLGGPIERVSHRFFHRPIDDGR